MVTGTADSEYANPQHECDLIMKGGATSGLVYPRAVLELARQPKQGEANAGYRFGSIGGTSAGAVAAAFTAAAEYNRNGGGFEKLDEINRKLQGADVAHKESGGEGAPQEATPPTYLRDLFQGSRVTQPLLNILIRMARYIEEFSHISSGRKSLLLRIPAYLRLALRILKESAVLGVWEGRLIGVLTGVLLAALLAVVIGVRPWPMTGFWDEFAWELTVLGVIFGLAGFAIGGPAARLYRLYRIATTEVPRNLFGICSGLKDEQNAVYAKDQPAAMEFIHASIQEIAGRSAQADDVLTFAKLRERNVVLELTVTDISEGRPHVLPFDKPFIFREEDFKKLFPEKIMESLVGNARKIRGIELPAGYHFLPKNDRLPVAVAVRMSMCFPLIFSSVPLYSLPLWARERIEDDAFNVSDETLEVLPTSLGTPTTFGAFPSKASQSIRAALQMSARWHGADEKYTFKIEDLIPHWFSDGGIASNFPIHFFDKWLPKNPTFGITLRYLPGYLSRGEQSPDLKRAQRNYYDAMEGTKEPSDRNLGKYIRALRDSPAESAPGRSADSRTDIVVLPRPQDAVPLEWQHICYPDAERPEIGAVIGFLWAVVKTMQNYRDNTQAALPSYRERVVQIRLGPGEGGFNLAMDKRRIEGLAKKGELAGTKLNKDFVMPHHQWARLYVLVSELDEKFRAIREDERDEYFETLVGKQQVDPGYPFHRADPDWCNEVKVRLQALRTAMKEWQDHPKILHPDAGSAPPVLRVTPNV